MATLEERTHALMGLSLIDSIQSLPHPSCHVYTIHPLSFIGIFTDSFPHTHSFKYIFGLLLHTHTHTQNDILGFFNVHTNMYTLFHSPMHTQQHVVL